MISFKDLNPDIISYNQNFESEDKRLQIYFPKKSSNIFQKQRIKSGTLILFGFSMKKSNCWLQQTRKEFD
jgi:hypothetical protein